MIKISQEGTFESFPGELPGPRLLVSVCSAVEAISAIEGGASLLDVKEPSRGSLGMADSAVIDDIAARVRIGAFAVPLSVALGELKDWNDNHQLPRLPAEVTFAKMGLSNLAANSEWQAEWCKLRQRFDSIRNRGLQWVAVTYADDDAAKSPGVDEVLSAAIESECAGLLVDTFSKTGQGLTDFLGPEKLTELADRCHAAGLFLALAGSLSIDRLPQLSGVAADVIAIRSAACRNSERHGPVNASSVQAFRTAMTSIFHHSLIPQ